jgi:hypothetical protein
VFQVCNGLNLLSLPLEFTGLDTADLLLASICGEGEANALWEWLYESLTFRSWTLLDTPPGWPTTVGMPFWVNVLAPVGAGGIGCTWTVVGQLPAQVCYNINPGLNLIAIPVFPTTLENASDLLAAFPGITGVYGFSRAGGNCLAPMGFQSYTWLDGAASDFVLYPGYGYWVAYAGLPFEWCLP